MRCRALILFENSNPEQVVCETGLLWHVLAMANFALDGTRLRWENVCNAAKFMIARETVGISVLM